MNSLVQLRNSGGIAGSGHTVNDDTKGKDDVYRQPKRYLVGRT
jgi:hypothetical protein